MTRARLTLLGRAALERLKILQKVNAVEAQKVKKKFPSLFRGIGKLDGPDFLINLKPDEKSHADSTPRRVRGPVPLLSKVKEELSRMELKWMSELNSWPRW